jgi:ATP-dependent Clp protease ATP-binding subunit ClpC
MKAEKAEGPDTRFLESVGQVWSRTGETDLLVEPLEWKELLQASENAIGQSPPRSLLVRGETKAGKTSFLRLLGDRLARKGWTIIEAGGPELQAGQTYIGQLEDRMKRFFSELTPAKKAIWYVPDILQIAVSGTHHGQTASILDQALPALHAGRLIIITEATPARLTLLNQIRPNLRGVFEIAGLAAMSEERTLSVVNEFATRLGSRAGIAFDAASVPLALQLVRQYMNTSTLPGVVFDLVKLSYNRCMADGQKSIGAADMLATLSQLTGLPRAILDANEKVELEKVHRFFGERVMGQSEAVHAVVDRIAMLKAGLTDPGKPIGVFLFAGPTGTGKTELAKTLAEYLFGSGDRMIRLDMSEFKHHESISKIVGETGYGSGQSEALTNRVRKQPFSVVLLDEFEKAHPNVWDLFLQVFDDGRLGDANGNVADFRHCIIILTSNLGATVHQNSGLGFGAREDVFSPDQVLSAVAQAFRPEFVNRLDKVIVFQPLKRDLMRDILKKELKQVLERRGLRNREWAVEWESSVLDFLLDRGFSAQLGARPLKRAIDQYLLAPLAATIVEHRVPEGDQFLFVRSDGRAIQVEFVDPDAEAHGEAVAQDEPRGDRIALAGIIMSPLGTARERAAIELEHRALRSCLEGDAWRILSDGLALEMADPAFWSRQDRSLILSRYALMDRVKAASQTVESLRERLDKSRDAAGHFSAELMARLARQVLACRAGSLDALTDAPVEAVLAVEPALDGGGDRASAAAWSTRLTDMYRAWARKRGMQIQEFVHDGVSYLAISGFGAFRTLTEEAGLHVFEPEEDDEDGSRSIARVRVVPAPPSELKPSKAGRTLKAVIEGSPANSVVVRRYRSGSSPLVRDARRGWRSGKTEIVLAGDFDLVGAVAAGDA